MKKIIFLVLAALLFNGCAVKDTDNLATKTAKHTANAPLYVIIGTGLAVDLALQGAIIGTAKVLGVKPSSQIEAEKREKEALEAKELSNEAMLSVSESKAEEKEID